jgi:ferredoxin
MRASRFHVLRILHFYVYARWTTRYLITAAGIISRSGPHGKRWFADRYHGKVLTFDEARAIIQVNKSIPLQDLDQIIPFPMARDFVLQTPLEIAVLECPCRHARARHCEPIQVCLVVGQPFVDFVLEHHPDTSRRLTPSEAAALLEAEHRRGHVHSAWFKNVCLGRFFAICNCCKCCCGGIEAMVRHGIPMMTSSGYVARVDESLCVGCGRCEEACPFEAITVNGQARVDTARCLGCGVCVGQCRQGAASLIRDADKGTPLDVRLIGELGQEPTSPIGSHGLPAEQRR